jgi:hypothetical protein
MTCRQFTRYHLMRLKLEHDLPNPTTVATATA